MARFKKGTGKWKEYRQLPRVGEIDFHPERYGPRRWGPREQSYEDNMAQVWDETLEALQSAQQRGCRYLLITHGRGEELRGGWRETTVRSQVRKLMRSPAATPYIIRSECIQHEAAFVAAIRPE
jgi:hypothetical protein